MSTRTQYKMLKLLPISCPSRFQPILKFTRQKMWQ